MLLDEFLEAIRAKDARTLADDFLRSGTVAAFPTTDRYEEFKKAVQVHYARAEYVAVVGTANWTYSLNPHKNFKPYDAASDVDTVLISSRDFTETWNTLRAYHRRHFYGMSQANKDRICRNGQNVYAGFVSPLWIPDVGNTFRFAHQQALNVLSDRKVNFKTVTMLFFRDWTEAVDYYTRGFRIAKGKLR